MIKFAQSDIQDKWSAIYSDLYFPNLEFDDTNEATRQLLSRMISYDVLHEGAVTRLNELGIT
jgi:hypothetical protein